MLSFLHPFPASLSPQGSPLPPRTRPSWRKSHVVISSMASRMATVLKESLPLASVDRSFYQLERACGLDCLLHKTTSGSQWLIATDLSSLLCPQVSCPWLQIMSQIQVAPHALIASAQQLLVTQSSHSEWQEAGDWVETCPCLSNSCSRLMLTVHCMHRPPRTTTHMLLATASHRANPVRVGKEIALPT